jgi:hypothetical protein
MRSNTETIFDTPQSFISILAFNTSHLAYIIIHNSKECLEAIRKFDKDIRFILSQYPNLLSRYEKIRQVIIAVNQGNRKSCSYYVNKICNGNSRGF